jgi:hypothetical protein
MWMLILALFIGLPVLIGYALPPRWAPWLIAGMAVIVAATWQLYDGSFHNDPWPFLVTPAGVALVAGAATRFLKGAFLRARIKRGSVSQRAASRGPPSATAWRC